MRSWPRSAPGSRRQSPFCLVTIRAGLYADDDTVIVIGTAAGSPVTVSPTKTAMPWTMKLADGKVIDGTAFYDNFSLTTSGPRSSPGEAAAFR